MCHLIFLVPLAGIPLFWLLPLDLALPINIAFWIIFGLLGYKVMAAMMKSTHDGFRSLIGSEAMVVWREAKGRQYLVKAEHELWTAKCGQNLRPGEKVKITGIEGIKLVVAGAKVNHGVRG